MCVFTGSRNQNPLRYTKMVCKLLNNFVSFSQWFIVIHIASRNLFKVTNKSKNS